MKIGITGSNGFIGSYLKRKLKTPIVFKGNLRNIEEVREFVVKCDKIFHLAGKNRGHLGEILENNIISTSNIVLSMILENKFPEIVFSSSKQVDWDPNSEYGFMKIIEEEIIKKTDKWCIYRIPNVYGPGCKPFYNSVVSTFCYQISKGQKVTIHDPNVKREFIYIDDLIEILLKPKLNGYQTPKGEILTINQIYEYLTTKLGQHKKLKTCLDYYRRNGHVSVA